MGILRVVLAIAVLQSHLPAATFRFIDGALAVQAFFVVSGFYMSLVLSGKYTDTGLFYTNRLLRLLPAYFVVLALAAFTLLVFDASHTVRRQEFLDMFSDPGAAFLLAVENLAVVGQDLLWWFKVDGGGLIFAPASSPQTDALPFAADGLLVQQSWTLSLELMFYAAAPFLARLHWRWLVVLCGASILIRLSGYWLPVNFDLWHKALFPTVLFLFLLGMLAHRAMPLVMRAPAWTGYAACAALLAVLVFLPATNVDAEAGRWIVYLGVAAATPFIFNSFRDFAWDRWVGDLSYPIYLSHLVVIGMVQAFAVPAPVFVTLAGTVAISVGLKLFVDNPVDRWRQARARRPTAQALVPAAAG